MPAHAGFVDAVALQAIVNGAGLIAGRDLAKKFLGPRFLRASILLKGTIAFERDLAPTVLAHPRLVDAHFPFGKHNVAILRTLPRGALPAIRAAAFLDFLFEEMVDNLQTGLAAEGLR